MALPPDVGDRITIPGHDAELRREVEAHGFWPEIASPQSIVMRRDYPEGILRVPARPYPLAARIAAFLK
jgi:hypothetical protein